MGVFRRLSGSFRFEVLLADMHIQIRLSRRFANAGPRRQWSLILEIPVFIVAASESTTLIFVPKLLGMLVGNCFSR